MSIRLTKNMGSFKNLNLHPLHQQLKEECSSWATRPLNLMGRINDLPLFDYQLYLTSRCIIGLVSKLQLDGG